MVDFECLDGIDLALFDGAGGDEGAAAGGDGTQSSADTRQSGSGGETEPKAAPTGEAEGKETKEGPDAEGRKQETAAERKARYKALVQGEFNDLFTADTKRIIDQRLKEQRALQSTLEAQQPIMDRLMVRYGARDAAELAAKLESDDAAAQAQADKAGKTLEQYRADEARDLEDLRRERELKTAQEQLEAIRAGQFQAQQVEKWALEAEETQALYPDFDLAAELDSEEFVSCLRHGVPVKLAYELTHLETIKAAAAKEAADERERAVLANIKARGGRPPENGGSAQNPVSAATGVSATTREEREELARRAMRGEKIVL